MEQQHKSRLVVRLFVSLCLLGLAVLLFVYRQTLIDMYAVQQFKPSPAIAAITERTKLTDRGRFYFYASHPELKGREAFNKSCNAKNTEQSIVLGCYSAMRIYVFDVENPKLDGIREVTAAHEMLHAAYDRLSSDERDRVDGLVEAQLNTLTDERILSLIKEYDKTEPGERFNELHSILGTEVAALNPELEAYYTQYFSDRSAVVSLAKSYGTVFDDLKARLDALLVEIKTLADNIEKHNAEYSASASQLNVDIGSFNARARSGSMSRSEFDAQRNALESRQSGLQALYNSIKSEISLYDEKRSELESINSESEVLNRSIDSKLSPVPNL